MRSRAADWAWLPGCSVFPHIEHSSTAMAGACPAIPGPRCGSAHLCRGHPGLSFGASASRTLAANLIWIDQIGEDLKCRKTRAQDLSGSARRGVLEAGNHRLGEDPKDQTEGRSRTAIWPRGSRCSPASPESGGWASPKSALCSREQLAAWSNLHLMMMTAALVTVAVRSPAVVNRCTVEFAAAPFVANPQSMAMPQRLIAAGKEHKIGGLRQKA
jgi:hypothetical protein